MAKYIRNAKSLFKNYSLPEVKTVEATSNDPWFPSISLLNEISRYTFHKKSLFEIIVIIDKRLNDHGKNWRHVVKSLILLEHLSFNGHEFVYKMMCEKAIIISTLGSFVYIDKDGRDQGQFVRERAKRVMLLINDKKHFIEEKNKILKINRNITTSGTDTKYGPGKTYDFKQYAPKSREEEDMQLEMALAISREEAENMKLGKVEQQEINDKKKPDQTEIFDLFGNNDHQTIPKNQDKKLAMDFFTENNDPFSNIVQNNYDGIFSTNEPTNTDFQPIFQDNKDPFATNMNFVPENEFPNDIFASNPHEPFKTTTISDFPNSFAMISNQNNTSFEEFESTFNNVKPIMLDEFQQPETKAISPVKNQRENITFCDKIEKSDAITFLETNSHLVDFHLSNNLDNPFEPKKEKGPTLNDLYYGENNQKGNSTNIGDPFNSSINSPFDAFSNTKNLNSFDPFKN